jgi:putative transposase
MGISPSSYYYRSESCSGGRPTVPDGPSGWSDGDLVTAIESIVLEFDRYGYRRVTRALHRQGLVVNHKRVLRVMREKGLLCKRKRRFKVTTDSRHGFPIYPNLVQDLPVTDLDQVWVADITYIGVRRGFVYLAAILDKYSRKVIGYAIDRRLDTTLTLAALEMAIRHRRPMPGVIHHSDRGSQYASGDYVACLQQHSFWISMSRKGNPYDNAAMESFFKTVKMEEVYLWEYQDLADVQKRLDRFLWDVYNEKRLHSSLGYRPPNEFEALLRNEKVNRQTVLT